ncbi:MAG TPA: response regulator transcription factor [Gaiellaceae bacterium]|nr:response regulator transcription factor [Gaiellaceae bacterium]
MLVDDHGLMLAGACGALQADRVFEIVGVARTGSEALPLAWRTQPDAVLVDLTMPGTDGLRCLRQIRTEFPNTKVIICSASADRHQVRAAFEGGAHGYIVRAAGALELSSAIHQAIEGTAYRSLRNAGTPRREAIDERGPDPSASIRPSRDARTHSKIPALGGSHAFH